MLFWKKSEKSKWLKPPAVKNQAPPQKGFWERQPADIRCGGTFTMAIILMACLKFAQTFEVDEDQEGRHFV